MKQISKIVIAVAFLIGMTSSMQAQSKVAHINTQSLVEAMPSYKTAMNDLEKLQASIQADIDGMGSELQKTMDRYQREAGTQTDEENARRMQEVQVTRSNIAKYQQSSLKKLQDREQELLAPILEKARTTIQKVARAKSFDYVLDSTTGAGGVLLADGYDLMSDVKKDLGI